MIATRRRRAGDRGRHRRGASSRGRARWAPRTAVAAEPVQAIRELTGGGAHVSLDALGPPVTCVNSVRCLRRRGRHAQVGLLLGRRAVVRDPDGAGDRARAARVRRARDGRAPLRRDAARDRRAARCGRASWWRRRSASTRSATSWRRWARSPRRASPSSCRESGLADAEEVARGVAHGGVAGAPELIDGLLQHLGARRAGDLLEGRVEIVGAEVEAGAARPSRASRRARRRPPASGRRAAARGRSGSRAGFVDRVIQRNPSLRDLVAHVEAKGVAVEGERGVGVVDEHVHGADVKRSWART